MWFTKVRLMVALLLFLGAGGGGLVYRSVVAGPAKAAGDRDESHSLIDVPSRVDGVLLVLGTEIKEGEKVSAGRLVTIKTVPEAKAYRRLRIGDAVEEGQLLARLDDQLARDELAIKLQQVEAARAHHQAAEKSRDEAEQRYLTMQRLYQNGVKSAVSLEDVRGAKLTWDNYFYDAIARREAIKQAEAEARMAETRVRMHEIRSPVSGVITKLYRHRGEAARAYDPVLQILPAPERD
jgi:multidrug efflux pump subunit AcrA (membrane-fusion protein)